MNTLIALPQVLIEESVGRRWLASGASLVLIIAGALAYRFAVAQGGFLCLLLYAVALAFSAVTLRMLSSSDDRSSSTQTEATESEPTYLNDLMAEDVGLEKPGPVSVRTSERKASGACVGIQQSLDFDGMGELKTLDQITGGWLASEASDAVSAKLREACLSLIDGNESEHARVERWFDISDCLRSPACQSLAKAEARRSYAAEVCGVSKEQVRQIDQGRYAPLNKLLELVNPQTL